MLNELYNLSHKVHCIRSYHGGKRVITLVAEDAYLGHDVIIWTHSSDPEVALDPGLRSLLDQIAKWTGGWEVK